MVRTARHGVAPASKFVLQGVLEDVIATEVAFDVVHAGAHTTVLDRGRFSKGVLIEHQFDTDFTAAYSRQPDTCTVASITFADGRRWTAPVANDVRALTDAHEARTEAAA